MHAWPHTGLNLIDLLPITGHWSPAPDRDQGNQGGRGSSDHVDSSTKHIYIIRRTMMSGQQTTWKLHLTCIFVDAAWLWSWSWLGSVTAACSDRLTHSALQRPGLEAVKMSLIYTCTFGWILFSFNELIKTLTRLSLEGSWTAFSRPLWSASAGGLNTLDCVIQALCSDMTAIVPQPHRLGWLLARLPREKLEAVWKDFL